MRIILSVGGSVLGADPSSKKISNLVGCIRALTGMGDEVHLVIGGGPMKQTLADLARELKLSEYVADVLGTGLTRVFARLVAEAMGDLAFPLIPESIEEAVKAASSGKSVVMGGTEAGHSTTAVAALLAEALRADMVLKVSDVDGVYSKNPKMNKDAVMYDEMTYGELSMVLGTPEFKAGTYDVLDSTAIGILSRSSIPTVYFSGAKSFDPVLGARSGEVGTYVSGDNSLVERRSEVRKQLQGLGFTIKAPGKNAPPSPRTLLASKGKEIHAVTFRVKNIAGTAAVRDAVDAAASLGVDRIQLAARAFTPGAETLASKRGVSLLRAE